MDDIFKALADPSRRRLLDRLHERDGQSLGDLCDGLEMARQSVSKHLAVLEASNLISTSWRGREKLHFLNAVPINAIAERWMSKYDRAHVSALANLKIALEQPSMEPSFVYVTFIRTTPEKLWEALTQPAFTRQYWGVALTSDWQPGSTVTWDLEGITMADEEQVVLVADRPRTLSYTWHTITPEFAEKFGADDPEFVRLVDEEPRSKVTFAIAETAGLVKLTVTHEASRDGATILAGVSHGWPPILASLKSLLETGTALPLNIG